MWIFFGRAIRIYRLKQEPVRYPRGGQQLAFDLSSCCTKQYSGGQYQISGDGLIHFFSIFESGLFHINAGCITILVSSFSWIDYFFTYIYFHESSLFFDYFFDVSCAEVFTGSESCDCSENCDCSAIGSNFHCFYYSIIISMP